MNHLVVDLETIPDVHAGRRLLNLDGLSDAEVAQAMALVRRGETSHSDFMRHTLHEIVCISCVLRHGDQLRVWSLSREQASEAEMLQRFFAGMERYTPVLITWNGLGFDLPVLAYRTLLHGITAEIFWDQGERDASFRYNNYLSRYHQRHIDLMDVLSFYQPRAAQPLDHVASMLGFPGKMGMSGAEVWPAWLRGEIQHIRTYCETDVMNTWLVFLRFQKMRGWLDEAQLKHEESKLQELLAASNEPVWQEFLKQWTNSHE